MAKRTTNTKATATADETSATVSQEDAATIVSAVSDPSGKNGPDGTNTPESASGAVAGEASAEPVKPQEDASQTGAIVAEAVTGAPTPEAETAASGMNSESSSQEGAAGDAGANAGGSAALTAEQVNEIRSRILGIEIEERREFVVYRQVRHDGVLYPRGGKVIVTKTGHDALAATGKVSQTWEHGLVVEG